MGFWDSLLGRAARRSPEEVRALLFDAVTRGDAAGLAKLAAQHEATAIEHFAEWAKVPEDVRRDPAAVQAYAHCLIAVAEHFAEVRGRPEPLEILAGRQDDNPLARWQRDLEEADARMEACDFAGAAALLRARLDATKQLSGSGVDSYLPITLGRLGACAFEMGDVDAAVPAFERACALCVAQNDEAGVHAYLGSLYEVHRYRADGAAAARCLEQRAELYERAGERVLASRDRRRAAIVRSGEPPCRVMAELGDELFEIADVPRSETNVRFVFVRNRITLRAAEVAVEDGIARGRAGDLEGALASFARARAADRFDPWPSYHAGSTLLHLRRYREAVDSFRRTEELAPGWYHCRADRWLAEQLSVGAIDHASFVAIRELVDGALAPARALALARRALAHKELGILHLVAGHALTELDRHAEAEAEHRRGLAIAEEPDVRTRLLTALGACVADGDERTRLLRDACELRGNLVAAAMAALLLQVGRDRAN